MFCLIVFSIAAVGRDLSRLTVSPGTVQELLAIPPERLANCDIALVNMLCTEGLPGAEGLDIQQSLSVLDRWAGLVDRETRRYIHLYRNAPEKFRGMEGYYRMQMLITVVMQDLKVNYNPARDGSAERPEPAERFFSDSRDLFLHGLVNKPHLGTCASLPVLYTAIGRRLGYPLKLVCARAHLFLRWESADGKERFNIEGTNGGMSSHDDKYYWTFPLPITEEDIRSGQYLKSLSPAEELAAFLCTRGNCLQVHKRYDEARTAYRQAQTLAPHIRLYERCANQKILNP